MTRRKREIVGLRNERYFPHLVELALPLGPFRSVILEIDAFHRERRIPVRRGRSRHEVKQVYIRFCFPDTATADAFRNRFGGECLTHAPVKPKPRTSATSSAAPGGDAGGRGGLGQKEMAITPHGKNRTMIFGPKNDGTYVVEFRTAAGEALAISIPRIEAAVIRHFQERMPYGLFVPDAP